MSQLSNVLETSAHTMSDVKSKPQPSQVELAEVCSHHQELKEKINSFLHNITNVTTSIDPDSTMDVYQIALHEAYDILMNSDPSLTEHEIITFPLSLPKSIITSLTQDYNNNTTTTTNNDDNNHNNHNNNPKKEKDRFGADFFNNPNLNEDVITADFIIEYHQGSIAFYLRPIVDVPQTNNPNDPNGTSLGWHLDVVLQLVHPTSLIDSLIQVFYIQGAKSTLPRGGYLDQNAFLTALQWAATYTRAQDPLIRELALHERDKNPNGLAENGGLMATGSVLWNDSATSQQRKGSITMAKVSPTSGNIAGSPSNGKDLHSPIIKGKNGDKSGDKNDHKNDHKNSPNIPSNSTKNFFPSPSITPTQSSSSGPSVAALAQKYNEYSLENAAFSEVSPRSGSRDPSSRRGQSRDPSSRRGLSRDPSSRHSRDESSPPILKPLHSSRNNHINQYEMSPVIPMTFNGFNDTIIIPKTVEISVNNTTTILPPEEIELSYQAQHELASPTHAAFYGASELHEFDKKNIENNLIVNETPYLFSHFQKNDSSLESLRFRLFFGHSFQEYCDYFGILNAAFDHQQALQELKDGIKAKASRMSPIGVSSDIILEEDEQEAVIIPPTGVKHGTTLPPPLPDHLLSPIAIPTVSTTTPLIADIVSIQSIQPKPSVSKPLALPLIVTAPTPSTKETPLVLASPRVPSRPHPSKIPKSATLSAQNDPTRKPPESKCICINASVLVHDLLTTNIGFDAQKVPKLDNFEIRTIFEYAALNDIIPLSIILRTCRHIMGRNHDQLWYHLWKMANFGVERTTIGEGHEEDDDDCDDDFTPLDSVMSSPHFPSLLQSPSFTGSNKSFGLGQGNGGNLLEFIIVDPYQDFLHDETNVSDAGSIILNTGDNSEKNSKNDGFDDDIVPNTDNVQLNTSLDIKSTPILNMNVPPPPPPPPPPPKKELKESERYAENHRKKRLNLLDKAKAISESDNQNNQNSTTGPPVRQKPQPLVANPSSHAAYVDTNLQLLTPHFNEALAPTKFIPHSSLHNMMSSTGGDSIIIPNQPSTQNTNQSLQSYQPGTDFNTTNLNNNKNNENLTKNLLHSSSSDNLNFSQIRSPNPSPSSQNLAVTPLRPGQLKIPIASLCEIVSSIDMVDANGWTPLFYACFYGHIECVKLLLTFGANPHFVSKLDGASPLYVALDQHHFDVCDLLVQVGVNLHFLDPVTKMTPLMFVAKSGNLIACDYLIRHPSRISLNTTTITEGYTALCLATLHNHITVVDMLLVYKADLNIQTNDGYTALMLACSTKNELIADLLISSNAYINTYTHVGITALVCAITQQNYNLVYLLLSKHANANPMKHRSSITPIIASILNNDLTLLQTLVQKYGAMVNTIDYQGRTALMHACTYNSSSDIIKFLISQGAELNTRDNDGKTALALANEYGHHHLVRMLFGLGAKRYHLYHKTNEALQLSVINLNKKAVDKILQNAGNVNLHLNMIVIHSVLPRDPELERYGDSKLLGRNDTPMLAMGNKDQLQPMTKQQQQIDLKSKTSTLMDESDYTLLMYCIEKDSMVLGIDYHNLPSKPLDMALLDRGQYNYLNYTNNLILMANIQSNPELLHNFGKNFENYLNSAKNFANNQTNSQQLFAQYSQYSPYDLSKLAIPGAQAAMIQQVNNGQGNGNIGHAAAILQQNCYLNNLNMTNADLIMSSLPIPPTGNVSLADSGHHSNGQQQHHQQGGKSAILDDSHADQQLPLPIAKHNNVLYQSNNIDPKLNRRASQQFQHFSKELQANSSSSHNVINITLLTPDNVNNTHSINNQRITTNGVIVPPPPPPGRSKSPHSTTSQPQIPPPPQRVSSLPPPLPQSDGGYVGNGLYVPNSSQNDMMLYSSQSNVGQNSQNLQNNHSNTNYTHTQSLILPTSTSGAYPIHQLPTTSPSNALVPSSSSLIHNDSSLLQTSTSMTQNPSQRLTLPPTVHIQPTSSSSRSFGFHLQRKETNAGGNGNNGQGSKMKKELKFGPRIVKYNTGNGLGYRDLIDLLLKNKADVNDYTSNGGISALMLCAKFNRKDLCKILLKEPFYADINSRDNLGRSVLGYATIENNIDLANWLFGQGARL
jgi:ankyrin repeat protein